MLDVVRELLPFVAVLYLVDALVWVGAGALLLRRRPGGSFRAVAPGLRLAGLLPGDRASVVRDLPIAVTSEGVYLPRRADAAGAARWHRDGFRFVPLERLAELEVEHRTLRLAGEPLLKLASPAQAAALVDELSKLAALPPGERPAALAAARARAFDGDRIAALRDAADGSPAVALGWLLFGLVFAGLPLAVATTMAPSRVAVLLAAAAVTWIAAAAAGVAWARRLRALGGFVPKAAPWQLFYLPPSAAHPARPLLVDLYARFDPLAVAAELLPAEELAALARRELSGARLAAAEGEPGWVESWRWRAARLRELAEGKGLEPRAVAPAADPSAAAACPVCGGLFRAGVERCADCDVALVPTAASGRAAG